MSDKPTNGVGAEDEDVEPEADEVAEAEAEDEDDGEEIPVEVEDADTRPVKVPDLGAALSAGTAEPVEAEDEGVALAEGEALSHEDLLGLLGQAEQEKAVLAQKLEEAEKEKKDNYERLLRSVADMENLRKRTRKDVEDSKIDAKGRALKEILPVIDNLDRAVTHAEQTADDPAGVIDGIRLVLRQFEQALDRLDVKPVDAKGKPFDPNIHEAVSQVPSEDVSPGSVLEVLQRGYTIGARLLRPSLVVVAQAPPAEVEPAEAEPAEGNGETDPIPMPPADDEVEAEADAKPEADAEPEADAKPKAEPEAEPES